MSRLGLVGALVASVAAAPDRSVMRVPAGATSLKMLHISDTHFRDFDFSCDDVPPSGYHCGHKNTTQFMKSLIDVEKPDMVVHTGDVIDGGSWPPKVNMDTLYGESIKAKLPWAASLGNHDEECTMSRDEVMDFIVKLPGTLAHYGVVEGSPGNYYIDVLGADDVIVARLVFFDSRIDHVHMMINDEQLAWFKNLTKSLQPVPTLAFYHIPLQEYKLAIQAGLPISGGFHEPICDDGPNAEIFPALKAGGVVAGFCGHDHTNDFCVNYQGIDLCYEGSPGFTAYGNTTLKRRARVTVLELDETRRSLKAVRSWKRLDAGGAIAGGIVDDEELWAASGTPHQPTRAVLSPEHLANLGPERRQKVTRSVEVNV